jgi:short subunit dehydrogenase-like uncharacterized protein
MGRVICFGATGYTGRLTAHALASAGLPLVLAGRTIGRLSELADDLAHYGARPSIATADVTDAASVRALLESPDDVIVTTVGPFVRLGDAALEAAVDAGAAYVDSTGEPPFVRRVFEDAGPRAETTGARLLTAFGYDYVPGNLAGALVLDRCRERGTPAGKVEVGYFVKGNLGISSGTRASAAGILLERSFAFTRGAVRTVSSGGSVRRFDVGGGRQWEGLAIGGSEHFTLPRLDPALTEVGVYLGWAGRWTRAVSVGATALGAVSAIPGVRSGLGKALAKRAGDVTGEGPSAAQRAGGRSIAVARAYDLVGRPITSVRVEGPTPYELTAELLAWAAAKLLVGGREVRAGALGPADAFGFEALRDGCAAMGLVPVT